MGSQVEEIKVVFKTEGGEEVAETLNRTAAASDHFHQKVTKAGGALGDLRLKAEARVANNLGAIAQALTGGASAGEIFATSITKLTESFRGSLLFAGAATVGFALYQGITKAGEAVIALDTKLADLKRSASVSGDFIGADKVGQNLDNAISSLDELRAKFVKEHTGLGGLFDRALRGGLQGLTGGELESQDATNIAKARQAILGALSQTADKQKTLNAITREGLSGDEKKAELAKILADHHERAARISAAEAKVGIVGGSKAQQGETTRFNLENAAIEKRFKLQADQLASENEIVEAEKLLLLPAEENLKILGLRISALRQIRRETLSIQDAAKLDNQQGALEAGLRRAQFGTYQRGYNPGAFAFQKGMNDQQRADFDYFRAKFQKDEQNRTLYPDLDKRSDTLREYQRMIFGDGGGEQGLSQQLGTLIQTLNALPAKVGVG